jgi:hypothetical protein
MMLLADHIENVRAQPEHIRRQIALTIAVVLTAIVALLWFGMSLASGAFALKSTSFAEATSGVEAQPASPSSGSVSRLFGAVGAAFGGAPSGPARVEVIQAKPDTTRKSDASIVESTVLPF